MREITSPDNPKIKLYRKLAESKKHRRKTGLFTLEGARLVTDSVKENAELHSVFVTEKFAQQGEALYFPDGAEVYLIPDELGAKISSTETAQGVFAISAFPERYPLPKLIESGGRYIVLHKLQDPGNLGTVIRTADAVGIDAVFLSECCDLYNPKTVRSTMGSLFRVRTAETSLESIFPLFSANGVPTFAAVIDEDAVSLTDCDFSSGGAVLIGNEGNGLPEAVSAMCGARLTIKMQGNVNSLNAAMAAGIIMWEFAKEK